MTRRDILKGLVSLPVFGLFFQQFFTKRHRYNQRRDQIFSELSLEKKGSQETPSIISKLSKKRFLELKLSGETYWKERKLRKQPLEKYYRQF